MKHFLLLWQLCKSIFSRFICFSALIFHIFKISTYIIGLWGLSELKHTKYLEQYLLLISAQKRLRCIFYGLPFAFCFLWKWKGFIESSIVFLCSLFSLALLRYNWHIMSHCVNLRFTMWLYIHTYLYTFINIVKYLPQWG